MTIDEYRCLDESLASTQKAISAEIARHRQETHGPYALRVYHDAWGQHMQNLNEQYRRIIDRRVELADCFSAQAFSGVSLANALNEES